MKPVTAATNLHCRLGLLALLASGCLLVEPPAAVKGSGGMGGNTGTAGRGGAIGRGGSGGATGSAGATGSGGAGGATGSGGASGATGSGGASGATGSGGRGGIGGSAGSGAAGSGGTGGVGGSAGNGGTGGAAGSGGRGGVGGSAGSGGTGGRGGTGGGAGGTGGTNACAGVACTTPPAATCAADGRRRTFTSPGTCSGGICSYASVDTACGSNQVCAAGSCATCGADTSCGPSCAACGGSTPRCSVTGASSACVACLTNADCGGTTPACNTTTHACGPRPSCAGIAAACGANGNADCCASSVIPGGTFYRSYDGVSSGYTSQTYPATVSDFRLDRYEITVGRFRNFVAAYSPSITPSGAGKNPNNPSDTGWNPAWNAILAADKTALTTALKCHAIYGTWTDAPVSPAGESVALSCLDWYEAEAFCIWDGGRLATEAEWNYAAAGGTEQRAYPWSNPPTSTTIDDTYAVHLFNGGAMYVAVVGSRSPKGDGRWGQADMAGNVVEWVQDGYANPYAIVPCTNCAELGVTSFRMVRGGGANSAAPYVLTSLRANASPSDHGALTGARCARSVP